MAAFAHNGLPGSALDRKIRGTGCVSCERWQEVHAAALERIERLKAYAEAQDVALAEAQAKIDRLMLEYCPDEMTCEQMATWAAHQRPVENGELP